ncbi:MAG TPA: EamA family transporter [Moraxellaceae bacterium]|nr:EamA family transporter [Moraxellaceae bacterium]
MAPLTASLWLANIVLDTGGQLAFKAAAHAADGVPGGSYWARLARARWLWAGISCYVAEFLVWLAFLSLVPLSEGVLLGSINIVAIMLAGRLLFREALTPLRVAGILLVSIGVAFVGGT